MNDCGRECICAVRLRGVSGDEDKRTEERREEVNFIWEVFVELWGLDVTLFDWIFGLCLSN